MSWLMKVKWKLINALRRFESFTRDTIKKDDTFDDYVEVMNDAWETIIEENDQINMSRQSLTLNLFERLLCGQNMF